MLRKAVSAVMLTLLLTSMLMLAFNVQLVKADPLEVIIDTHGDSRFTKYPSGPYWWSVEDHDAFHTRAYNNNFWYTYCGAEGTGEPLYFGTWYQSLSQSGVYEVFVWIPNPDPFGSYTPTHSARYQIYHKDGMTERTVNQGLRTGGWYSVGTYTFDTSLYVILNDRTGEPYLSTMIAFDAIKFVQVNIPPTLSNGYVSPSSGDTSTTFSYYVTYSDPEGDIPTTKYVYIDGSPYTMTKISGDYVSGATFKYSTTLSAGSHNYYFYFDDGHGHAVRLPTTSTYFGPNVFDFTVGVSPSSGSVQQGGSVSATVTVTLVSGSTQTVSLTASGLPSYASATFSPSSGYPTFTSTFTISTSSTTPTGTFYITIRGSGGGLTRTATYELTVIPPVNQPPNKPTGASQYRSDGTTVIPEGGTTPESTVIFKATVSDPNGDSVRLEIELRQIGEPFTGQPTPETISDYVPSGTQVTITRYGLVNADYHWRYRAKDIKGNMSDWTEFGAIGNIDFRISVPTEFSISASPTSLTIQQRSSGTSTITITSINGFNQPVQVSVSGAPSGVTATLSPSQVTPPAGGTATSTLTVAVATTATPGSYTLTVTGTSGALTHNTYISLEITAAPPPPNQPPNPPALLNQYRTDGTEITVGGITVEDTVVFKGIVSDPDGDHVKLQVELRGIGEYGGEFNETAGGFKESGLVQNGNEAVAYAFGLNDGGYHWRARTVDEHGNASEWVDFGKNEIYWADFAVDTTPPETYIDWGPSGTIHDNDVTFKCSGWDTVTPFYYLRYSYYLEGYDSDWSDWAYSDQRSYTDLPNGDYTFKVKAKDDAGHVDPSPAERSFTVSITGPHIDSLNPPSGAPGIQLTIKGLNLAGSFQLSVTFGTSPLAIDATIISANEREIVVIVPPGKGTVNVWVMADFSESNRIQFTFEKPIIKVINPSSGIPDTEVTIEGEHFGFRDHYHLCAVKFGKSFAEIISWEDTKIVVKAPSDYGTGVNDAKFLSKFFSYAVAGDWGTVLRILIGLAVPGVALAPTEDGILEDVVVETAAGISDPAPFTWKSAANVEASILDSPVELRVYDSQGRITGLVKGEEKNEIPYSHFFENGVIIFLVSDSYDYKIVGTEDGLYGLTVISITEQGNVTFVATDIPTSMNVTHQYTVDWVALSQGEEGVTVNVDSNGDGVFEHAFTSDSELTQSEFLAKIALYTFSIVWGEETFIVSVESNSTVSNFVFSQPDKEISFNVTGEDGTIGFCNVTIPKALLYGEPWTVLIDGAPVPPTITENATHTFLYFTYTHSTHLIQIIGTWVIGPPPPITYSLTITTTVGGTTDPAPGTYNYTANSSVQVTAIPDADYIFDHWELDTVNVGSANPYTVLMDNNHTLKAVFTYSPPPPSLSASISPLSASILVGQSVTFTSTVSGGYTPYTYQWYLNGNPVSGATSNTWVFTPTTGGIYYVHLKVTDAKGSTAQSDTARITAATVPVGGYSIPIDKYTIARPLITYTAIVTILTATFIKMKRKAKRKR